MWASDRRRLIGTLAAAAALGRDGVGFPATGGPFSLYLLEKRSLGTIEALDGLRRRWNLDRKSVSYGGLKDRHAVTRQHVTVLGGPREGFETEHVRLSYLGAAAEPFKRAVGAPTYGFGPHVPGRCWQGVAGLELRGDREYSPDHVLADGDVIKGAGWTIEAVHTPGHIHNHLCFAFKEEDVLFSGDHVMGWSTTVVAPPDGDMRDYMVSLDKLLARGEGTYWPTHGPAITEPGRHVRALIAHREGREDAIAEALAEGVDAIDTIVKRLYAKVPEHLHPAAARTALSHLVHMIEKGRVACDGAAGPESRFRLT